MKLLDLNTKQLGALACVCGLGGLGLELFAYTFFGVLPNPVITPILGGFVSVPVIAATKQRYEDRKRDDDRGDPPGTRRQERTEEKRSQDRDTTFIDMAVATC